MMGTTRTRTTAKIMKYELRDVLRSRSLIAYSLFFAAITDALLRFGGGDARALLSLMNVVLLLIPLVAVVFATMYLYHAREFMELLLAQPVRRRQLFAGLYLGLAVPLALAFVVGAGVPLAFHGVDETVQGGAVTILAVSGVALTFVFVGLAALIAVCCDDRVKGLGVAIGSWLLFAVLYDGLVLLLLTLFADYPLERPALALMIANPIDLARVVMLLRFDVSALMGYTGAVFERFFGGAAGISLGLSALLLWAGVPTWLGARVFHRKDF